MRSDVTEVLYARTHPVNVTRRRGRIRGVRRGFEVTPHDTAGTYQDLYCELRVHAAAAVMKEGLCASLLG